MTRRLSISGDHSAQQHFVSDDAKLTHSLSETLGVDDDDAGAWLRFRSVARALCETINRDLAHTHDLTLMDVRLLEYLRNHGQVRMGVLAEALMVTPSRLTQQAQRLERRGLVRRSVSNGDGRRVFATITREGVTQLTAAMKTYARLVRRYFLGELSRPQMIALGDVCRRISDSVKATGPAPRLPRL